MHDVDLDVFDVNEFTFVGDLLHREQAANDFDCLAHRLKRLAAIDSDLGREGLPPHAESTQRTSRRQIVERRKGRGYQRRVAGPVVDHPGADFDSFGRRSVSGHRDNRIPNQPGFSLPHRFEASQFGVANVVDGLAKRVFVLKIECDTV